MCLEEREGVFVSEGRGEVEGVSSVYIRVDLKVDLKKGKERTLVWFCLK